MGIPVLMRRYPLQWRYYGRACVSNHQTHHCLLNRLFKRRSKKTSKLHVTRLCAGNSPVTGEFPVQMTSNAENVFYLMTSSCSILRLNWVPGAAACTCWQSACVEFTPQLPGLPGTFGARGGIYFHYIIFWFNHLFNVTTRNHHSSAIP